MGLCYFGIDFMIFIILLCVLFRKCGRNLMLVLVKMVFFKVWGLELWNI